MSRIALLAIITLITSMGCTKQPIGAVTLEKLKTERTELDQTVFADETQAVRHEEVFIRLWDELRNGDPYRSLQVSHSITLS